MVTNEKIFFFHELVCCNYDMLLWVYDPEFHVEYSSADFKDMISTMSFQPAIEKHLASGIYTPLVLEAKIGLVWIVGFEHKDGRLKGIYLLGPSFTGRDTPMTLLKKMDNYGLSVKMRSTVTKTVSEVPVLPTNILSNYATMLHYTLNKEKISFNDISYSVPAHNKNFNSLDMVPDEHNGIWLNEQKFCSLIADGDPNYMDALAKSFSLSSGIKADSGDTLRNHKNNCLVLLTLCSRAAIQGGLNPSVAYSLNDYYAKVLEECRSLGETTEFCANMLKDYVSRVQEAKRASDLSPQIHSICYYIKQHLTESLSISDLAGRVGYTEYYFSHKFKKEVGVSIKEFISNEKIEQAKLLLSGTTQSIQEISDSLAFSNRSYFYASFQKRTGISPSEYRKKHGNLS